MRGTAGTALAAATGLLVLGVAGPAEANVRRFLDSQSDTSSGIDIWSVRVDNSTADRSEVRVRVRQDDIDNGDSIAIYIDTRPADPGPEFAIFGTAGSEFTMHRMEGWKKPGPLVPFGCGYRERINVGKDLTRAVLPRSCMSKPGKIRVAVHATRDQPAAGDWAPAKRSWLGFVRR